MQALPLPLLMPPVAFLVYIFEFTPAWLSQLSQEACGYELE